MKLLGSIHWGPLCLLAPLLFAVPRPVFAQDSGDDEQSADEEGKGADDDSGRFFAVVGGDIHTGTGTVLRGASLLAREGVIKAIGYDLFIPEEAEVLDASGLHVYPGLVAITASNISQRTGAMGHREVDEPEPPPVWPPIVEPGAVESAAIELSDSFDPFNFQMVLALASGITTVLQGDVAVKLKRGEIEGVVLREDYLATLSWSTRTPASVRKLKEDFAEAARYLREYRQWEIDKQSDKDLKEPSKKGVDSKVLSVLRHETRARFNADEREDLLGIARLAQTYGFRPVIDGGVEAWTVADELGRAGAAVVVSPRARVPKSEELVRPGGSSIENAAILYQHGVQVAIRSLESSIGLMGISGRDLMALPTDAGFAIRGGLPEAAAFEGITLVPARLMGVEHRVGSLEVGKDCDLAITDGDILHYQTFVQYTVVEGKVVYDKQKELYFAHIRPRPEREPQAEEEPPAEPEPAAAEPDEE